MQETVKIRKESIRLLPFNDVVVETLEIIKGVNRHTTLNISGTMSQDNSLDALTDAVVTLITDVNLEEQVLFKGSILHSDVKLVAAEYKFNLRCSSESIEMDIIKESRSFENIKQTYLEIVGIVEAEYDIMCLYNLENSSINKTIIQNNETDWQFLKRLASRFEDGLYNVLINGESKLALGLPNINNNVVIDENIDEMNSNDVSQEYIEDGSDEIKTRVFQVIEYFITSNKILEIGEVVTCRNMECYVKSAITQLVGGVVVTEYYLTTRNGMKRSILNTNN